KRKGRPYMIIFMTDGKPTIGETDEKRLVRKIKEKNISDVRIFTFGIGNGINTHLLDKITEATRASRTYITPEEDIEIKVSNFYSKVQSPVMTDIELIFGYVSITKTYPVHLPDLFKGSAITLLGRYGESGDAEILLKGSVRNKNKRITFKAPGGFKSANDRNVEKNDFIPSLWAARRVGYLLDQIRLHGSDKELVDEITQLARTYGILTPYTSYLIVEDEKTNVHRRNLRRDYQTLGRIADNDRGFETRNKMEYRAMKKSKTGAGGVRASKEVQHLNTADNFAQQSQGKARLNFKDKNGSTRNLVQELRNIQGRAVYNTGKFWVDSQVQLQSSQKVNRIEFAGDEYFKLLRKEPLAAEFLALGNNIRFVINNQIYEIYEE
ncbi:MAG: VWA domain-containing protein, partial [bacterium]|nr:VWA domain-containing protein [bacterium]